MYINQMRRKHNVIRKSISKVQYSTNKIYRKRNPVAVPYKTTVLVNGIEYDQINYNILVEENGKICVIGKKRKYISEEVYPNEKLQLIGEVMLSPGKTSLNLIVTDFLNKSRQINYNLTIY